MRRTSTLIVLGLLALGATARAEDAAPVANVNAAPAPVEPQRKLLLGAAFMPMALGKFKFSDSFTTTSTQDAYFAYGVGISGSYQVVPGLLIGLAPQAIFNVQAKPNDVAYAKAMTEVDVMARIAYADRVAENVTVYVEALPGYSLILPSDDSAIAKGLVLGFDVGAAFDMTDRTFLNVGGGYQIGFQSQSEGIHNQQLRTRYVRVALGGGVRF